MKQINEQQLIDQLKNEIAMELGIEYGADFPSKINGKLGGEVTKKLIELGKIKLEEMYNEKTPLNQPFVIEQNAQDSIFIH